jgi:hypothetical protein
MCQFIGMARTVYIYTNCIRYTVYLGIPLLRLPYIRRIYLVLVNSSHMAYLCDAVFCTTHEFHRII